MAGWIALSRRLLESPEWTAEPFTKVQAWLDLIGLARYEPGEVVVHRRPLALARGQLAWSAAGLAERWSWSPGKVKRYLAELEAAGRIRRQGSHATSVTTVINYDRYQFGTETGGVSEAPKSAPTDQPADQPADQPNDQPNDQRSDQPETAKSVGQLSTERDGDEADGPAHGPTQRPTVGPTRNGDARGTDQPMDQPDGPQTGQLADQPATAESLGTTSANHAAGPSDGPTVGPTRGPTDRTADGPRTNKRTNKQTPPPTPSVVPGGWGEVIAKAEELGVVTARVAIDEASRLGCTPPQALAAIEHYRAHATPSPPAWGPGALRNRLAALRPGTDPTEGWPPPSPKHAAVVERAQNEHNERKRQLRLAREKFERGEGASLLAAMTDDERATLEREAFPDAPDLKRSQADPVGHNRRLAWQLWRRKCDRAKARRAGGQPVAEPSREVADQAPWVEVTTA